MAPPPPPLDRTSIKEFVLILAALAQATASDNKADNQRKPLGLQEVAPPNYRCVSTCVTKLT